MAFRYLWGFIIRGAVWAEINTRFLYIECVPVRNLGVFKRNHYNTLVGSFGWKVQMYKLQSILKRSVEDMSVKQGCFNCSKCQSHTVIPFFYMPVFSHFGECCASLSRATCQYANIVFLPNCDKVLLLIVRILKHFISQNHSFLSNYSIHCYSQWMINVSYFLFLSWEVSCRELELVW